MDRMIRAVRLLTLLLFLVSCADKGSATAPPVGGSKIKPDAGESTPESDAEETLPTDDITEIDDNDVLQACDCPESQHCNVELECIDDLCTQGAVTCEEDGVTRHICNEDGSGFTQEPCGDSQACELGQCLDIICDTGDPPSCNGTKLSHCNSAGTAYNETPCPTWTECKDGECLPLRPNLLFLVDTSSTMAFLYDTGKHAATCEGTGCPPWNLPSCDDKDNPQTKLGRVKKALLDVLNDEKTATARIGLQRFPRSILAPVIAANASCNYGFFSMQTTLSTHDDTHAMSPAALNSALWEFMAVPLATYDSVGVGALKLWMDFTEDVAATELPCENANDCDSHLCIDGKCNDYGQPELHAIGQSPSGRSLFYAGEYLRQLVLVEGQSCQDDTTCNSPNHTCVNGKCHDPYASCRPTSIIMFTDGGDNVSSNATDFYNPRIQAKRLKYGLGCTLDTDCAGGAVCENSRCTHPDLNTPEKVCHGDAKPCQSSADCPEYACGGDAPCPGLCEPTGIDYTDLQGANVLRDAAGNALSITIHVVDASKDSSAASHWASMGGGAYASVNYENIQELTQSFYPLLDAKESTGPCPGD